MLDIGANQGKALLPYYARCFCVIAFEPIPDNVRTIQRNLFINGIKEEDRVALVEGSVSNQSAGVMAIYTPQGRVSHPCLCKL